MSWSWSATPGRSGSPPRCARSSGSAVSLVLRISGSRVSLQIADLHRRTASGQACRSSALAAGGLHGGGGAAALPPSGATLGAATLIPKLGRARRGSPSAQVTGEGVPRPLPLRPPQGEAERRPRDSTVTSVPDGARSAAAQEGSRRAEPGGGDDLRPRPSTSFRQRRDGVGVRGTRRRSRESARSACSTGRAEDGHGRLRGE